jgi:hypothetical protein
MELFIDTLNKLNTETTNIWENSPFKRLITMTSDTRGSWGEECIYKLLMNFFPEKDIKWDSNSNTGNADGSIFDILFNNTRIEVKTAMMGKNSSWQHENIYEERLWDILIFFDVHPTGSYLTIIPHSEMPFGENKHNILNKKSTKHLSAWKFDMSKLSITKGISGGITYPIGLNDTNTDNLKRFLTKNLIIN